MFRRICNTWNQSRLFYNKNINTQTNNNLLSLPRYVLLTIKNNNHNKSHFKTIDTLADCPIDTNDALAEFDANRNNNSI